MEDLPQSENTAIIKSVFNIWVYDTLQDASMLLWTKVYATGLCVDALELN